MKKLLKAGSLLRGLLAGVAVLTAVTTAHASPYASAMTNIVLNGSNYIQFFLNEGATTVVTGGVTNTNGVTVTVVTYPSNTTNVLGNNLPAGLTNFFIGTDTKYSISVTKVGTGVPSQTSTDTGFDAWTNTVRAIGVNQYAKYADSFGRVYVGLTSSTVANGNLPSTRGWGIYGLTPDMQQNSFFGGTNPTPICTSYQTNTLTFTKAPTNGNTFTMDGVVITWTTNSITNTALQVAVTNTAAASATNLFTVLNATATNFPGNVSFLVSNTVVSVICFAQNIAAEPYYTFATPGNSGPFGNDVTTGDGGFGAGPWRIFVGPQDGLVWVADSTDGNANIYQFGRNFESTNQVWTVTGRIAGEGVKEHGNINGMAIKGSLATGDLQIFTADNDMPVASYFNNTNNGIMGNGGIGNFGSAQETEVGDANEIYRYDISGGTFPITNTPVFACTLGLDGGFPDGQNLDVALGKNTNYVYATFRRSNYSDGNLQVFRADTGARVYTSLSGTPTAPNDVFGVAGITPIPTPAQASVSGDYGGVRISPDGLFIAVLAANSRLVVANLTNGIPDESSVIVITNLPATTSARGLSWDAADNLYSASSAQFLIRSFSLGLTTTCITSNDITGTNGSFQLILPPASASVVNNGDASQNYGSPTAGKFAINLSTGTLTSPVTVNFALAGTATNGVNYNITTGTIANGVIVATNTNNTGTVTFPAATMPGGGNWTANVSVTPTATPAEGPTLTVGLTILGGSTYFGSSPVSANVNIFNTGAQFFFVSASPTATTMSRSITNDYAEFIINRWGDVNGPGNTLGSVSPKNITLTTFTLGGTAVFGTDYTAGVQPFNAGSPPQDGTFTVTFAPGVSSIAVLVGNPVSHANVLAPPTNATILPTLTTAGGGTNLTSQEGAAYTVSSNTTVITEFDNAIGTSGEVVLWSDPLTNSSASYTVSFASTNLASTNVLPVLIPNYTSTVGGAPNGSAASLPANSNSFDVQIGFPVANENAFESANGVGFFGPAYSPPVSPVMAANGWNNVLRMTVNKQNGSTPTMAGVNLFPTTNVFNGNYALRFDMYLSIWSGALNNHAPLNFPRQFAAFGVDTQGTNTDWRLSVAGGIVTNTGSAPTNSDGMWFAIDAADQSLTPADFDGFASPSIPNPGTSDFSSVTAATENGVFKRPPFPVTDGAGAGTPINQWVNVSVETQSQTNVALFMDSSLILTSMPFTNTATAQPSTNFPAGLWTNGLPMLGYLQPYPAQSDESAFVYFSNVRVVELSPYINQQPISALVLAGSSLTLTSSATYASPGLTNTWFTGTNFVLKTLVQDTSTNGTNLANTLVLSGIPATGGTNYYSVYSDRAGSVTSYVAAVQVVSIPTNVTAVIGTNAVFTVTSSGTSRPVYQWRTNGVNLVANANKYVVVTTTNTTDTSSTNTLTISNVTLADIALNYTCFATNKGTNLNGNNSVLYLVNVPESVTTPAVNLLYPATNAVVSPAALNGIWGSNAVFTVNTGGTAPFTYGWQKGATLLADSTKYLGTNGQTLTISNLTQADNGAYTVNVTNALGSVVSSAGVLTVITPAPKFSQPALVGGNLSLSFTSPNTFDNSNVFILQSSPFVNGPYTNTSGAFTGSAGAFNVTVPLPTTNTFYRLTHID